MRAVSALLVFLALPVMTFAQSAPSAASLSVPRLISINGVFRPADGGPPAPAETVTLSIYAEAEGGRPLWQETQAVAIDRDGRYSLMLGATEADGVPAEVFASGGGQWVGTLFQRPGEVESARMRLTSVPYAVRATNADTLGGLPASAYMVAPSADGNDARVTTTGDAAIRGEDPTATTQAVLPGTDNFLAKYTNGGVDVANSAVYETGGRLGVGTTGPLDLMHVRFNNTGGTLTGYAVQNLGTTGAPYSGMLFYDQLGDLAQFQGFNNLTHEYRINNIARVTPGGAFNGSINFMVGSKSRFFVGSNGNVGMGTTTPAASLEVSNAVNAAAGDPVASTLFMTTFSDNGLGSALHGRKARGTPTVPLAIQNGDALLTMRGVGHTGAGFSPIVGSVSIIAQETFTPTANGSAIIFSTTPNGTTIPQIRMRIDANGNLSLGAGPEPQSAIAVARSGGGGTEISATNYGNQTRFLGRSSRGSSGTPSATQENDALAIFAGAGHGTTGFSEWTGGTAIVAAEDWTDAAHGTAVAWVVTPLGSVESHLGMVLMPDGSLGVSPALDGDGEPIVLDKLQVYGNIRVGTSGTDGCVKNFAGTQIVGTCASDIRFKKDITPFGSVLNQLTSLRPVHYFWRAAEFPERHFGAERAYGLIAQEAETVLPEIVVTGADGFKAVDYSKLPLLTVQAIKELQAENEALKQRVAELEPLKARLTEVERLLNDLLAAASRK